MEHTRFIGLDIHKERISIAVAESGRAGALEYHGEIANDPGAIGKLCDRLRRSGQSLAFCYEAGPCGYGVHRQLTSLGVDFGFNVRPTGVPAFFLLHLGFCFRLQSQLKQMC
jgi:hypothetical protein